MRGVPYLRREYKVPVDDTAAASASAVGGVAYPVIYIAFAGACDRNIYGAYHAQVLLYVRAVARICAGSALPFRKADDGAGAVRYTRYAASNVAGGVSVPLRRTQIRLWRNTLFAESYRKGKIGLYPKK